MSALDRLMENVHVYRFWQAPFAEQKFAPVARHNDLRQVKAVLDLGCGPGTNAGHFARTRYLGLDWNPAYVDYARRYHRSEFEVADVCNEEVTAGRRFDFILANSIFHHIPDQDARRVMARLAARLTPDGHVHIVDMVVPPEAGIARYLATHDRGEFPRSRERWEQMLCDAFEPVVIEPYHLTGFGIQLWHMVYFKGATAIVTPLRLSIAIPVFNEELVVPELLARLRRMLSGIPGGPHELVFVDDGSADRTFELLAAATVDDPNIVAIALSRNFGHQIAITAALDHVSGDLVVVMDGDLQDPPEAVPVLLAKQREGFDVVYAQRVQRKEGWVLRACYFLFYRMLATLSTVRLPIDAGDFAVLSRRVVEHLKQAPEHHRYLRGLRAWIGYRQVGIPIERARRDVGYSKYSPIRLMGLALDGVFAFSVAPLRVAAVLGVVAMCCSSVFAAYSVYVRLFAAGSTQGFTALILAMTFLAGVELLVMGIIGEYVGRIYEEVKRRPHYVIDRIARQARG